MTDRLAKRKDRLRAEIARADRERAKGVLSLLSRGSVLLSAECLPDAREEEYATMLTYADAESRKDQEAMRRIRAAEEKDGFKTGMRFSDGGPHIVHVSFYPKRKWWITDTDAAGTPVGEKRELTREVFDATHALKL